MQLGSPNLTYKCSTMSPGNQFIFELNGQRSRTRVTKTLPQYRRQSLESRGPRRVLGGGHIASNTLRKTLATALPRGQFFCGARPFIPPAGAGAAVPAWVF